MQLLFPVLMVALLAFMFFNVRRQKRASEKVASMQSSLKPGDRVTTTSGMYGTVVDVDEDSIDLEIAEDVVTTWLRAAVRDVRPVEASGATSHDASTDHEADEFEANQAASWDAEAPASTNGSTAVEESADDTAQRLTKE